METCVWAVRRHRPVCDFLLGPCDAGEEHLRLPPNELEDEGVEVEAVGEWPAGLCQVGGELGVVLPRLRAAGARLLISPFGSMSAECERAALRSAMLVVKLLRPCCWRISGDVPGAAKRFKYGVGPGRRSPSERAAYAECR